MTTKPLSELFYKVSGPSLGRLSSIISKYGTSLEETRKLVGELGAAIKKRKYTWLTTPVYLIPSELPEYGIELEEPLPEDWLLKITPGKEGEYSISYITPEKWEIAGEDQFISPEGEVFTKAQMEAMERGLTLEKGAVAPPARQFRMAVEQGLIPEGSTFLGIEDGQIKYRPPAGAEAGMPELTPEELAEIYGEQELYRWTWATQYELREAIEYAEQDPEGFLTELQEIGWNEDTERLLKQLGATDAEIGELFGEALPEIPTEGYTFTLTASETGETQEITMMPDYSVWVEGKREATYDPETQQFIPYVPLWKRILGYVGSALKKVGIPSAYSLTGTQLYIEQVFDYRELKKQVESLPEGSTERRELETELENTIGFSWGEVKEKFEAMPWWRQMLYELPTWLVIGAATPAYSAIRAKLLGRAAAGGRMAIPAKAGAAALRPAAAVEAAQARAVFRVTNPILNKLNSRAIGRALDRALIREGISLDPKLRNSLVNIYRKYLDDQLATELTRVLTTHGIYLSDAQINSILAATARSANPEWAANIIVRAIKEHLPIRYEMIGGVGTTAGKTSTTELVNVITGTVGIAPTGIMPIAGIPTMITSAMKADLTKLGYGSLAITRMTPAKAWEILTSRMPETYGGVKPEAVPVTPSEVTGPMDAEKWASMTVPEKVGLVKSVGLPGKVGSKAWFNLTDTEKITITEPIAPRVPEVLALKSLSEIKADLIAELKARPAEQLPNEIKTGAQTVEKYVNTMSERLARDWHSTIIGEARPMPTLPSELRNIPLSQMGRGAIAETGVRDLIGKFKRLKIERLPLEYKSQVQDILKAYDLSFRTNKTLDRRASLMGYIDRLKAEGAPIEIPEQYIEMASKIPLRDLTPAQLESVYNEVISLIKLGTLKNRLLKIQARRKLDEVVGELVDHLGKPPKAPKVITKEAVAESKTNRLMEKIKGFVNRTYRIERILLRMDKYIEGGLFQKTFWEPVEQATNEKIGGIYKTLDNFRAFIKQNRIDLGKVLGAKIEIEPGVRLTPSEKVGVYLSSLNEDNLLHLKYGNGFSDALIEKIVNSLSPSQKKIANWLHDYFQREGPAISHVRTRVEGKPLGVVENYFPIRLQWKAQPELNLQQQLAIEDTYRFTAKWASSRIAKRFLRERTHKAIQPVDLDALPIWLTHLQQVEHYKAFAEVVRDLQLIFNNAEFRRAFIAKEGTSLYRIFDKWLKQVAETNPLRVTSQAEGMLRALRVNAVTAVLGFNLVTALKQFPSFFGGAAEIGSLPALRGIFTYLMHPKETGQLVKELAPQIWQRSFEREIAEQRMMRSVGKRIAGKLSPREVFMFLTIKMDRLAVNSLWRGAFDDYLKKHPNELKDAAEYATRAIRRTQPFFSMKDLPEYWRSGEFMKAMTMFTNQLNQYWNYFRFDILGKTMAGKIPPWEAFRRIILMFIIPAVLIGWFTRSRPFKNRKEFTEDLTTMGLAIIPIFGNLFVSVLRGYYGDYTLITTELLNTIKEFFYNINKQDWDKVLEDIPELAGFLIGFPVSQPRRTFKGILALLQGETDDWLRLIWSEWVRERALELEEHPEVKKIKEEYEDLFELYDAYDDESSPEYIEDDEERRRVREELLEDNPDFRDARRRMTMYNLGLTTEEIDAGYEALPLWKKLLVNMLATGAPWEAPKVPWMDEHIVDLFVEYGHELDAHGANSAEALLFRYDHPELEEFGERDDTFDWSPLELTDTDIKRLRLIAENRELIDQREAWGDKDSPEYIEDDGARQEAYDKQLADNPEFRDDLRRMEAYARNAPTDQIIEDFVEYGKVIDEYGAGSTEAKLFKLEHPEMFKWGQITFEWSDLADESIDDLRLTTQWRDMDEKYDALTTTEEREAFLEANPEYAVVRRRRDAYDAGIPEKLIDEWVEYYSIPRAGWDNERYLKDHPDFYKEVWLGTLNNQEIDFDKVPSVKVEELFAEYGELDLGNARIRFRCQNKELDDWLVAAKGYKPVWGTDRCD